MSSTLYTQVNDRIIALLESGVCPWRKPWLSPQTSGAPRNLASGKAYRGVNYWLLNCSPYTSPFWATYRQVAARGGQVKKGEKGTQIVFWKIYEKEKGVSESGEKLVDSFPMLRSFYVFNIEQCEGLNIAPEPAAPVGVEHNPIESCEKLIAGYPLGMPEVRHEEARAFYRPSQDFINMPKKHLFGKIEEYYSTLFHEQIHATGHESRLNREGVQGTSFFGDAIYSFEELIAEMGASYMCAAAGIENATIENSAAYLSNWLAALRKDNKLIFKAASAAQKAVDFLLQTKFDNMETETT